MVNDTVIYSSPWQSYEKETKGRKAAVAGKKVFERLVRIRFFGQERDRTIIRLKDNWQHQLVVAQRLPAAQSGRTG